MIAALGFATIRILLAVIVEDVVEHPHSGDDGRRPAYGRGPERSANPQTDVLRALPSPFLLNFENTRLLHGNRHAGLAAQSARDEVNGHMIASYSGG